MTVIIYFTEDKKNFQVIRPQTEGENRFNGDIRRLVEHVIHSDFTENYKNYHHFEIID
jgi:hypothetical protein